MICVANYLLAISPSDLSFAGSMYGTTGYVSKLEISGGGRWCHVTGLAQEKRGARILRSTRRISFFVAISNGYPGEMWGMQM